MQDRPQAAEILDAVAEYLLEELRPTVPRAQQFKTLVAANLCTVVARELRAGPGPDRQDLALFSELLGEAGDEPATPPDELAGEVRDAAGELARKLRSGELDDRLDEVAQRLTEHVLRKLEVARPGYVDG